MLELERELGTPEGFARRVALDRDLPKLGILLAVLGVAGLAITASGVIEDLARGGPANNYLTLSGGILFWIGLPALLLVAGIVLLVRARRGRARLLRELADRFRARGFVSAQHRLGATIFRMTSADSSAEKHELIALVPPRWSSAELAVELERLRTTVAEMGRLGRQHPKDPDQLQNVFGSREVRYRGVTTAELWPGGPADIVLTTRRDGDALVVIGADPASLKQNRAFYTLR